jgi:hypothetical protein
MSHVPWFKGRSERSECGLQYGLFHHYKAVFAALAAA